MRRNPEVLWRASDGFLALALPGLEVVTVTGPGAEVWLMLARDTTLDDLVARLAQRYRGPVATMRRDVTAMLEQLGAAGFVTDG